MDFSIFFPYDLLPWQWLACVFLALGVGLTKAGFSGFNALSIPFAVMIFGAKESTGISVLLLCFGDVLAVLYYHRHAEWKHILKLLPWTLAGFIPALLVVELVPAQAFRYLMGGSILASLAVMLWLDIRGKDKAPPAGWWFSAAFGVLAGFATIIGNVSGALMSVFLLSMRLPKNSFVGTTAWYFLIVNFLKLPIQIFLWENITLKTLLFDVTLFPIVAVGAALGIFLIKKTPESAYRKIIMALTLVSAISLLI